ncbi:MAG: PVC-type heme-binding CxxCH protein [Gemmataceae bacterium]
MKSLPLRIGIAMVALALPLVALVPGLVAEKESPPRLELRAGDHISFLGNTLADRMQHDGWLETYLTARHPDKDLSIRNLGFSGDELTIRLRSANFGSPEEWLTRTKTDVVFAFFGYNESYADKDGLPKFKADLDDFITKTLAGRFNGKSAPRLVIFSPIAHEKLDDPNLPDGQANNRRLELYTAAMAEVAAKRKVPFVDLFRPTRALYAAGKGPYTINGVHLNETGNRELAKIIDVALFGKSDEALPAERLEKIRAAVQDKNFHWFQRYRTTDGYSVYGGRADLKFLRGQTNREVAQREMEVLDVMTANRDRRVWAAARGSDLKVDDSNTPPFIPVETNKPGPLPGGKHVFLDPEKAIDLMKVAPGMKVNLFASEKQFPGIMVNPVQMSWDTRGRLWVATWPTYPHWKPKEPMNDKLLVLEDTDGDGKADKCTVFADGLHCPTGFEFYGKGVIVAQCPDLWYLEDTDGDGKADVRKRILHGLDSADTHHASNSFVMDPGGAIYFQEGTFHHTQVETAWGPSQRCANAGVFRYQPRSQKFDVYVSFGFANPHGHIFDRWGRDIVIDGTGSNPYDAALFSGYLPFPQKHGRPPQVWQPKTRPCPGMEVLSSRHFPQEMQNHVLVANVIGFLGILRYKIEDDGASFVGREQDPLLSSTDPNFRPSDLRIGPDGALYFLDWHNPIIGHMQHNLRDPSRDREHGRIYRLSYPSRPLLKPVPIHGEPVEKLVKLLDEPEDRVRYRTRIELTKHEPAKVSAALKSWLDASGRSAAESARAELEALWAHQLMNVVDGKLLERVLSSSEPKARAAATRIVASWRDRLPNALDLLRKQAADEDPRVRLEAVRAASFFTEPEAIEVVLVASEKPMDRYFDFVREETMKALQPHVKKAIADGRKINFTTPAGASYFLRTVSTEDLLKMDRTAGVYLELLFRKGIRDEFRREALTALAKREKKDELRVLLEAIRDQDGKSRGEGDDSVAFDLVRLLTSRPQAELVAARADLEKLATGAKQRLMRELGYAALSAADGSPEKIWALGVRSVGSLDDLLHAIPILRDAAQRNELYPKVAALLDGLPKELPSSAANDRSVKGRYVRIELPGKQRTLTLAEVEVFSEGVNVARKGKASQSSTSHGGVASRAIDGNTSSTFADNGQTHTSEGTDNPWWEVDLGTEVPISSIVVWNRADGQLGTRLRNYSVKVLDGSRKTVFQKVKNPVPDPKASFTLSTESPVRVIRRAAMQALPTMRGREAEAIAALGKWVKDDAERTYAIRALLRFTNRDWPKDQAESVLKDLLAYVRKVPVVERTQLAVTDAMQLADNLAGLMPLAEARQVRKELGELGVRVLRLGTVIEQMIYDKERLVVQAGKPFEIFFENTDTMPHNFVIIQPGSLEEIGDLAEKTATQPGAIARGYVPVSPKIMLKSTLVQPRQSERLSWTAPKQPGVYPYVCTYPGHWRRMHGALYVVADLEAYQAAPEEYLQKNPLPIADPLLKFNRPRKEWKLEELISGLEPLQGRNHSNGRTMFTVATCVSCHKFAGQGQEYGPDLTKLDPKWTAKDVLQHIIDPSLKIDDKYRTWTFELSTGKSLTGMILEENANEVKLIENPLVAGAKPVIIKKATVDARNKSPNSLMPKGLVDKLTREEIHDLVAYIVSGGNPKHKVFQGGHDHGHGHGH